MHQHSQIVCGECGAGLSSEERRYYGARCERCETEWFDRIEAWRCGGNDEELDEMFAATPRQTH